MTKTDEELIAAARAVVERWDTPHWKDVPATAVFINRLRDALAGRLEGRGGGEAGKRPEGHCNDDAAWEEFRRQYAGKPRSRPDMTDFELANAVYMASPRNELDLLHLQTAAKERIRWLSIRLADALSREGEGWREIETAKPGPPVMLWIPGFVGAEVCVGVVRDCEAYGVTMLEWVDRDIGEPFETIDGPVYPTHWRPLPAPPSQGGE